MGTDGADHPVSTDRRVLEFVASRLVEVYGENPNTDYILNTRRIAKGLEDRRTLARIERRIDELFESTAVIHALILADVCATHSIPIPEESRELLEGIFAEFKR